MMFAEGKAFRYGNETKFADGHLDLDIVIY
jgi:hypothetical protein